MYTLRSARLIREAFLLLTTITLSIGVSHGAVDDDSILQELEKNKVEELQIDFNMKTFESCSAFEDVMEDYLKTYWENNYKNGYNYRGGGGFPEIMEMSLDDTVAPAPTVAAKSSVSNESSADGVGGGSSGGDFSQTNLQVGGVDESDIVKTDGKYLYYFNEADTSVYILTTENDATEIIKKINLPDSFYGAQLYVTNNRLVIIAGGYSKTDYSKKGYFINRNAKTYTVIFDTSSKKNPELIKLYSSDGDYSKSRRIGDYVYVLSRNYLNYPYYNIKNIDDIEVDAELFLPKKLDVSRTDAVSEQNLELDGKTLPFNVSTGDISDCQSISYSFPDEETLKNTSFNPGYNIISAVNINDVENQVTTKVIAGSNNEIYMSLENLYLTEGIYQANNFRCPVDAICAMPFFWGGTQNTLIHKLNVDKSTITYQDTGLIPGAPLNQYSMDEHKGNFRIITSEWQPEQSTGLYILDENLKKVSDLTNLAPGESFRSSRFIGDKLFLVTFEQIDPLFAIDLTDAKNPTVLGELKIPGFSTYLHPYDDNHLMGLGYDTQVNEWGGTQTAGVKLDLYKINYDKKCGDSGLTAVQEEKCESGDYKGIIVEQLYTETLGGKGSYSEALNNPRMFIWNANRKTLLLPATLYERDNEYRTTDYYDGLFTLKVDKNTGIEVTGKTTHIDITGVEAERLKECDKYSGSTGEPVCRELLNGEMYCEPEEERRYIPNYCYKDSDVWQYIGDNSYKYRNMKMKRALYIGDNVYGFSDAKIGTYDWSLEEQHTTSFK